jgi:hypothetical protein
MGEPPFAVSFTMTGPPESPKVRIGPPFGRNCGFGLESTWSMQFSHVG